MGKIKIVCMLQKFLSGISERNARVSFFLFSSLLFLSVAFFVSADDTGKNIFQDSDQDGLSNDEETLYKTDPLNKDTDGDSYMDGVEVESGYDPLKPAPGDKLVTETGNTRTYTSSTTNEANLTDQVSEQIAGMVQGGELGQDKEVTLEDIETSVQSILDQSNQEIILPDVDMSTIKIKHLSKSLKGSKREEQEKEDAVEYLTVMSYILANNSPKKLYNKEDVGSVITALGVDSLTAMASGNNKYLEGLSEKGEKTLNEIKDVEVPEEMLSIHVKAIQLEKYSMTLKDEGGKIGESAIDPLGQIASFSKIQGFLGVVRDFYQEISEKLGKYNITEIPIDL
ncbi:MAG: hypothetical protein KBD65_00355 [Candidatus Moranbacteria bacterium]|nr:hypothetical protein [Candidatus Moranbacteria bacterium]